MVVDGSGGAAAQTQDAGAFDENKKAPLTACAAVARLSEWRPPDE